MDVAGDNNRRIRPQDIDHRLHAAGVAAVRCITATPDVDTSTLIMTDSGGDDIAGETVMVGQAIDRNDDCDAEGYVTDKLDITDDQWLNPVRQQFRPTGASLYMNSLSV